MSSATNRVEVLHGVNLDMLGKRDPEPSEGGVHPARLVERPQRLEDRRGVLEKSPRIRGVARCSPHLRLGHQSLGILVSGAYLLEYP